MTISILCLVAVLWALPARAAAPDAIGIEAALGIKPVMKDGEIKVTVAQKELDIKVDGFKIVPAMGLTSWVAFAPHREGAMAMGDLVLLEDEIGPVQKAAIEEGLSVTAIHNHFLRDVPKVMFMHVGGMGKAEEIASSVRKVLDKVRDLRAAKGFKEELGSVESSLDGAEVAAILGHAGEWKDGVYKVIIGRPDVKLKDMGSPVSAFLGFNTWMAFQGSKEKAAVAGDFAMLEGEMDGVIHALVTHGIEVTAVHNHMVMEKPRIFFLHFWGVDTPANLARGLKAALGRTGKRVSP